MPFLFFALALLCLGARLGWEIIDPLQFWESKAWIYVRDAATLGPAVSLALLGIHRLKSVKLPNTKIPVIVIAATATGATFCVAHFVLLGVPAVADEAAYLWQGIQFNAGHLTAASGPMPDATIISYVYGLEGRRISVFFPGSALALALGYRLGLVELVNPLMVGFLVLVTYWSARRLFSQRVAFVAAVLFAISPFTLFQGASFFGHVWTGLLVVPAITLALTKRRRWEPFLVGLLLAATLFSRPVSAVVAGLAIGLVWIIRDRREGLAPIASAILGASPMVGLFAWYNYELTGSVFVTAHRYFLPDETLQLNAIGIKNALINLAGLAVDLNGLVFVTLVLIVIAVRAGGTARFLAIYGAAHLASYALYYNNGVSYGPRYLFEISPFITMLAAAGLTQWRVTKGKVPAVIILAAVSTLVIFATRAPLFHDRAEYLDLTDTKEILDGTKSIVLVTDGPFAFPDPMFSAFVDNVREQSREVIFMRETAVDACLLSDEFPDQQVYRLDMTKKLQRLPDLAEVSPTELCQSQK